MNVLLFVMTMLMLLATMTYARLDSFRTSSASQAQFVGYMKNIEREYINAAAAEKYDNIHVTQKEKTDSKKEQAIAACSRISFFPLFGEKVPQKDQPIFLKTFRVMKSLINFLYGEKAFFQELYKKRSNFVEELLVQMMKAYEALPKDKKIKDVKGLANLDLKDKELQDAFYRMLKGDQDTLEQKTEANDGEPFNVKEGYLSLRDFTTMKKKDKIRVYLASPIVLMALFADESAVQAIKDRRLQLYKDVKGEVLTPQEAQVELRNFVFGVASNVDEALLNFEVSKTDPKKYWITH